jgi:hypothetical protein
MKRVLAQREHPHDETSGVTIAPPGSETPSARLAKEFLLVIGIALTNTFFLLPYLKVPFLSRDESIYAYFAQHASRNYILYRDFWEVHFPGLYYVYALCFRIRPEGMECVRALHLMNQIAGAVLFYLFLKKLLRPALASIGALVYAAYAVSIVFEGQTALGEAFLLTPAILGMLLFLKRRPATDFLAGIAIGIATLHKQNAILLLAFPFFYEAWRLGAPVAWAPRIRAGLRRFLPALLGGIFPIAAAVLVFAVYHAARESFSCTIVHPALYRSASVGMAEQARYAFDLMGMMLRGHPFLMVAPLGAFLLLRKRPIAVADRANGTRDGVLALTIWLTLSIIMTVAGARPFAHYLLLVVPPLCGLAMLTLAEAWESRSHPQGLAVIIMLGGLLAMDLGQAAISNAKQYVGGDSFWNRPFAWEEVQVGDYIRARTAPGEPIFVWGPKPAVYYFAERGAPTRHVVLMGVIGANLGKQSQKSIPGAAEELERDLRRNPPAYFVLVPTLANYDLSPPRLAWLRLFLRDNYVLETTMGDYRLFRRKGVPGPADPTNTAPPPSDL